VNCGTQLYDGAKFCTGCGVKIAVAQGEEIDTTKISSHGLNNGNRVNNVTDDSIAIEYILASSSFFYVDTSGKRFNADTLFKMKNDGLKTLAKDLVLGLNGIGVANFAIKVKISRNRICFNRLTITGKPTDLQIQVTAGEITLVELADSFWDKSITITTHSNEKYKFDAPKKLSKKILDCC
jgi:hypothetical protein